MTHSPFHRLVCSCAPSTRALRLLVLVLAVAMARALPAAAAPSDIMPIPPPPGRGDARWFPQTGFRIDSDAFWDYFQRRGGLETFGYPTSRTFLFLGFPTQFFQRHVMQLQRDGRVGTLNVLDPGLMPYTTFNGSTFPPADSSMVATAPLPGSPAYGAAAADYARANTPNVLPNGMAPNFGNTLGSTVPPAAAFGARPVDPGLLYGFDLEIWGLPTSHPTPDPNNANFIYQRFQRGIMHFDATCPCTHGILMADYLKAIITGLNLPPDLAQEAAASPLLRQYDPTQPHWIRHPDILPGTDLTAAFQPTPRPLPAVLQPG